MLDEERRFYAAQADEWAKAYPRKFVVVKGEEVVGFFDTLDEALTAGASKFGLTSFLVRQLGANVEAVQVPALTLGLLRAHP
jgi:hypothetical protein